jgi:hypothetical protein
MIMVSTLHLKYSDIFYNVTTLKTNPYLPDIEWRCKRLQKEVNTLEFKKQRSHIALSYFKSQIEKHSKALNSFHISCEREVRVIENLYNKKQRLESLVNDFKSDNEEYLKLKQAAHKEVKSVLTNSKILLRFATASVIESLRRNPELCNFVSYVVSNNNYTTSYGSNSLLLMSEQEQKSVSCISNDICTALILGEAEKIYNKLTTDLTNWSISATATIRESSLPLPTHNNNRN